MSLSPDHVLVPILVPVEIGDTVNAFLAAGRTGEIRLNIKDGVALAAEIADRVRVKEEK